MFKRHSHVLVGWDFDYIETNIMAAFVDAWVTSHTHDHFAFSSPVSVGFHGQEEALSSAAGDVSDTFVITMEET